MVWNAVQCAVHGDARWLVLFGGVVLLTLTLDRLMEMFSIALSLRRVQKKEPAKGLARTLRECIDAAGDSDTKSKMNTLGDEVRLRLPKLHRRWWAHHDPTLATVICIAPLAGMATMLLRLGAEARPTTMLAQALAPTWTGIVLSIAGSLLLLAMQLFDFPSRMTRLFLTPSPNSKPRSHSVVLRAHAAPMAVLFFVCFADTMFGLWARSLWADQWEQEQPAHIGSEVVSDGTGPTPVFLELVASTESFTLGGRVLPQDRSKMLPAIGRIVKDRFSHGWSGDVLRIAVRSDPTITVGALRTVKVAVQAALLNLSSKKFVVRFEE